MSSIDDLAADLTGDCTLFTLSRTGVSSRRAFSAARDTRIAHLGCGGEPGAVDVPCWFFGIFPVGSVLSVWLYGQNEKAKIPKPMMTIAPTIARYGLVVSVRWPGGVLSIMGGSVARVKVEVNSGLALIVPVRRDPPALTVRCHRLRYRHTLH